MARQKATVAEWVATRPIFDVCAQETGYEGGGRLRVPWLRHKAAKYQMRVTVEDISEATRVQKQQESGRRDGSKGGSEGGITNSGE